MKFGFALFLLLVINFGAFAVEPNEILKNDNLEQRARLISSELRCLVCQNENIDSSNSEFASDLRVFVRKKLKEGLTDQEIKSYLISKYGEFILLKPRFTSYNIILYLLGPIMFIFGLVALFFLFIGVKRKRKG